MPSNAGSINRPKRNRWSPNEEQKQLLKKMAGLRMPMEQMAVLLEIDLSTLNRAYKYDSAVRDIMNAGRSTTSYIARDTLFYLATKKKDFQALRFWCQTQEGFKIADRIEHTGADGSPITTATVTLTAEQREAEIERLLKVRNAGMSEDEDDGSPE